MERVTIEQRDGSVRIHVNYKRDKIEFIIYAILMLIPAAVAVPIFAWEMTEFPEMVAFGLPAIVILSVSTAIGLLALWIWCNYQQMISLTQPDGLMEVVNAHGFITIHRFYDSKAVLDLIKDSKRASKAGDKFFLWLQYGSGQKVKMTHPSPTITKSEVDQIYDTLIPHFELAPPIGRLAHFHHITIYENDPCISITFRTRLHFLSVRYLGILYSMIGFLAFPVVLTMALGPEVFPSMLLYPGSAMMGLILLLFLPILLPMRKKHLLHNHNTSTLQIDNNSRTVDINSFVQGFPHGYVAIPFSSIKSVPIHTGSELTFAHKGTTEYTLYYTITLNVGSNEEIHLYETENYAEALHVRAFLESLIPKA